jgi:hypothetical protein
MEGAWLTDDCLMEVWTWIDTALYVYVDVRLDTR